MSSQSISCRNISVQSGGKTNQETEQTEFAVSVTAKNISPALTVGCTYTVHVQTDIKMNPTSESIHKADSKGGAERGCSSNS